MVSLELWQLLLGIGSPLGALVAILVWLIRRVAAGRWYTDTQVGVMLAEKDKTIVLTQTLASTWQDAAIAKDAVIAEQATTIRQSTDFTRYLDISFRSRVDPPLGGHNGVQTSEGVPQ